MIVIPPLRSPELPMPATALPPIRVDEELATPQMSDPTSKRKKKKRYVHFHTLLAPSLSDGWATNLGVVGGVYLAGEGLEGSTRRR